MDNFGTLIKVLRVRENLTQKDFADKLNTSCTTVSKWENNKSHPDITTLRDISHILNVTCDELLNPTETLQNLDTPEELDVDADEPLLEPSDTIVIEPSLEEVVDMPLAPDAGTTSAPEAKLSGCFKKPLLIGICTLLAVLFTGLYIYEQHHFEHLHTYANHGTPYGDAYEFAYCHKVKSSSETLLKHADTIKDDWKKGLFKDCTSDLLIVSYYLSEEDFEEKKTPYFRAYYSDVDYISICKAISFDGIIIPDSTITVSEEVRGSLYVGTLRLRSFTHGVDDTTATYTGTLTEK